MISPEFYIPNNLVKQFFGGKVQHYPLKEKAIVLSTWDYIVKQGDTMYTLAATIFGEDKQFHWTIISDINYLRQPYDLEVGETIKLPIVITFKTRKPNPVNYAATPSSTTKI